MAGAVVCGALGVATVIAQAWGIAIVVSDAAAGDSPRFAGPVLVILCAVVLRSLLSGATELLGRRAAEHAMAELRRLIAARALAGMAPHLPGARRGEIATAAVLGVDSLADYYARAVPAMALAAIAPVVVIGVVASRSPLIGALLALTVPVLVIFMILVGRTSAEHARERQHATATLGAHFLEVVRGLPILRANGRVDAQALMIQKISDRHRDESVRALRVAFLSAYVLELFAMIGTAMAAAVVGVLLAGGNMDLETGLFVLILAPEVYLPLRNAGQRFHAGEDAAVAASRLFDFLDEPLPRQDRRQLSATRRVPDPGRETLSLCGAGVIGGAGRPAPLPPVDLEIAPGESMSLVGPSGSGKSTLIALLARLRDPDLGAVSCGPADLRDLDVSQWWRMLSWLPQRPGLKSGQLDHALLTGEDTDPTELDRVLRAVGADEVLANMPEGSSTRVRPDSRPLSAGQLQRLALAGVLASRAPLVLLDEPTAHLDRDAAVKVGSAILESCAGRTLIVATHDLDLARRCDSMTEMGDLCSCVPRNARSASGVR